MQRAQDKKNAKKGDEKETTTPESMRKKCKSAPFNDFGFTMENENREQKGKWQKGKM